MTDDPLPPDDRTDEAMESTHSIASPDALSRDASSSTGESKNNDDQLVLKIVRKLIEWQETGTKCLRVSQILSAKADNIEAESLFAGRFRLIKQLGQGGFGRVYLAIDTKQKQMSPNREVALKTPIVPTDEITQGVKSESYIPDEWYRNRRAPIERWIKEIVLHNEIADLAPDGIVPILSWSAPVLENLESILEHLQSNPIWFAMPVYEQTLKEYVENNIGVSGWIPVDDAVRILKKIAVTMQKLHNFKPLSPQKVFIHRDLKPSNILIDKNGNPLIADFGLAINRHDQLASGNPAPGTPWFQAPELMNATGEASQRTDIWAWGVIAYWLLSGQQPFPCNARVKNSSPADSLTNIEDLDDYLPPIVMKCLAKDPTQRFGSFKEVLNALDVHKLPASRPTLLIRYLRAVPAVAWYAMFAMVLVISLLAYEWVTLDPELCFPLTEKYKWYSAIYRFSGPIVLLAAIVFVITKKRHLVLAEVARNSGIIIMITGVAAYVLCLPLKHFEKNHTKVVESTNLNPTEIRILVCNYRNSSKTENLTLKSDVIYRLESLDEQLSNVSFKIISRDFDFGWIDTDAVEEVGRCYLTPVVFWGEYDSKGYFTRVRDLAFEFHNRKNEFLETSIPSRRLFDLSEIHINRGIGEGRAPHDEVRKRCDFLMNVLLSQRASHPELKLSCLERALNAIKDWAPASEVSDMMQRIAFQKSAVGDFDGAFKTLATVISEYGNDYAYLSRASICILHHQFEKALLDLDMARQSGINPRKLQFEEARYAEETGDLEKAIRLYEEYLEKPPRKEVEKVDFAFAYNNLANVLKSIDFIGSAEKIADLYDKAIETEPRIAAFWRNRAVLNLDLIMGRDLGLETGDFATKSLSEIINDCNRAIRLEPSYLGAHHALLEALILDRQFGNSIEKSNQLLKDLDTTIDGYVLRGVALHFAGRSKEAHEAFDDAVKAVSPEVAEGGIYRSNVAHPIFIRRFADSVQAHSINWILDGIDLLRNGDRAAAMASFHRAQLLATDEVTKTHVETLIESLVVPLGN